jgi:alpha-1,6-mannosyltransferase
MESLLNKQSAIVSLTGAISLFFFGYYITRDNELSLFLVYAILTGLFFYVFPFWKSVVKPKLDFKQVLVIALLFRLVLLFSTPSLSDDYHRFIWDGELISNGNNPYEFKPVNQEFDSPKHEITLKYRTYNKINSKEYYSVYPPVNQVLFGLVEYASGNKSYHFIILLRLLLICFDMGVILLLAKLLKWFSKKKELVVIYALNPLVITELTGNLHFEGVTLFFVLASIWFLIQKRTVQSGLLYALAICTKLIPILFLPLFIFRMKWKKLVIFYCVIGFVTLLLFLPFMDVNLLDTFGSSISLYFKTFEFNGSLYNVFREIGFQIYGYNQIENIGKIGQVMVLVSAVLILIKSRRNKDLKSIFKHIVWLLLIYYAFASIVHPWYIIYLLTLSIFTNLRFPLVWSFVVVLSYYAYRDVGVVNESYWLIGFEYLILLIAIVWDVNATRRIKGTNVTDL